MTAGRAYLLAVGVGLVLGAVAAVLLWPASDADTVKARRARAAASSSVPSSPSPASSTTGPPSSTTRVTASTVSPDRSGAYAFPVEPASGASYGRSHHDYPATDVFAPCGTRVVAMTSGLIHELSRVDQWIPSNDSGATRGGLFVSMVGDDRVRYYGSHLDSVAADLTVGDRVEAGRLLGTVGDSGNARGTDCHLHFGLSPPCATGEWSVRRGVVYPWPYLDAWRAGEMRSPAEEVAAWATAHPDACEPAKVT